MKSNNISPVARKKSPPLPSKTKHRHAISDDDGFNWSKYWRWSLKKAWDTQDSNIYLHFSLSLRKNQPSFILTEEQCKNLKGYRQPYLKREMEESFFYDLAIETRDFEMYCDRYPQGRYTESCRYQGACEKHDFEGYLKHYPQRKYDELLYCSYACRTRDFKAYILRFPQGKYAELCYFKLACYNKDASIYLNNYPQGRYVHRIQQTIDHLKEVAREEKHHDDFKKEKLFYEKCMSEGHLDEYYKRYPDKEYAKRYEFMKNQNPTLWFSALVAIFMFLYYVCPYLIVIYLILHAIFSR